jgi:hypothetical protein
LIVSQGIEQILETHRRAITVKTGSLVDATIIASASETDEGDHSLGREGLGDTGQCQ